MTPDCSPLKQFFRRIWPGNIFWLCHDFVSTDRCRLVGPVTFLASTYVFWVTLSSCILIQGLSALFCTKLLFSLSMLSLEPQISWVNSWGATVQQHFYWLRWLVGGVGAASGFCFTLVRQAGIYTAIDRYIHEHQSRKDVDSFCYISCCKMQIELISSPIYPPPLWIKTHIKRLAGVVSLLLVFGTFVTLANWIAWFDAWFIIQFQAQECLGLRRGGGQSWVVPQSHT